jgi:hypothetical protein
VGGNWEGQLGDGTTTNKTTAVAVSSVSGCTAVAGSGSSSAFMLSASVKSVGDNGSGQLGDGTTTSRLTAVAVSGIAGYTTNASDLA